MSSVLEFDLPKNAGPPMVQLTCTPMWFLAGGHWCSAFWHKAVHSGVLTNTCAVLCPSLVLEQVRGVRHQRVLARMLASSGIPSLRLSFPGTDNSSGHAALDGDEQSLIPAWCAAIIRATEIARGESQCKRVVVIGRRIGALVALRALRKAAKTLLPDTDIILWDPTTSGANFLRETRIRHRLRHHESNPHEVFVAPSTEGELVNVEQAFIFNRETVEELETLALDGELPANVRAHIVAPRIDRRHTAAISDWPAERVLTHIAPDAPYDFDRWEGPDLPTETFRAILRVCLGSSRDIVHAELPVEDAALDFTNEIATSKHGQCSRVLNIQKLGISEEWVCVDDAGSLAGILTKPTNDARAGITGHIGNRYSKVLLMLGTGVDATPGESDANVRFARRVAATGIPVLRLDFRGIGESPSRSAATENRSYEVGRTQDVTEAAQFLQKQFPSSAIVAMGICSGAYWGIHAAAEGVPLAEVIAVNPQLYGDIAVINWQRASSIDTSMGAIEAAVDMSKWRKLLTGKYSRASVLGAVRGMVLRARERLFARDGKQFTTGMPCLDLQALFPATTRFHLAFSRSDSGYVHLIQHGPSRLRKLNRTRKFSMSTFRHADHTFSTPGMRAELEAYALEILAK